MSISSRLVPKLHLGTHFVHSEAALRLEEALIHARDPERIQTNAVVPQQKKKGFFDWTITG